MRLEGAEDWMVVRVVVRERTEGAADEKVLPSPPPIELKWPPAVDLVPAFDCAVSEFKVSGFVATVGAADLLLIVGGCWLSLDVGRDCLLCVGETKLMLRPESWVDIEG
jgi:hypothetical protein